MTNRAFSGLAHADFAPAVIDQAGMGIFALPRVGACLRLTFLAEFDAREH